MRAAWGSVAALAVLLVVALVAAGVALQQRATARSERDTAIFNQITAQADRSRSTNISLAAQLDLTHPRQRQRRPHDSIVENKRQRSDPADLRYYREHPYPGGVGAVRVARLALSPAVPVMAARYTRPVPEVKGVNP
ncbi:MAG: hypothetical protein WCF33_10570 [Pseudonocardiaceae bacterium]